LLASLRISYSSPRVTGGIINVSSYSAKKKWEIITANVKYNPDFSSEQAFQIICFTLIWKKTTMSKNI
jgi:hypothetical protein